MPDEIDYDKILNNELAWWIDLREKTDPTLDVSMRCSVVVPPGKVIATPLIWHTHREKHKMMNILSAMCSVIDASAAVVISDAHTLNMDEFCAYFHRPKPTKDILKEWNEEYLRIMKDYGGSMSNLPKHLVSDMIFACAYGPRVKAMRMVNYTYAEGKYNFQSVQGEEDMTEMHFGMIPAWWN